MRAERGSRTHDSIEVVMPYDEARQFVRELDGRTVENWATVALRETLSPWFPTKKPKPRRVARPR